jgi:hypothetical protein
MKNYNTINGKGYRYISQIPEIKINGLPRGILNKMRSDVGGTFTALTSLINYIVVVPSLSLIDSIMGDENITCPMFSVRGGVHKYEFIKYIEKHKTHKIVVTYDSFLKVTKWLFEQNCCLEDYRVLIDEFHNILDNFGFRSKAINNLIKATSKFNHVTYMSATPIRDPFIPDFLKKEPVTIIEWGESKKIQVESVRTHNPIEVVLSWISRFLSKKGLNITGINDSELRVRELFIYVNSVKDISTICKSAGVNSKVVKVVCSDSLRNIGVLKDANIEISEINAPNKQLNFFTAKAFAGANLFSNNGLVIVVSNSDKRHTLIDLQTSLYQIFGRLRENDQYQNVFRHLLIHICASIKDNHPSWNVKYFKNKAAAKIKKEIDSSKVLISNYNSMNKEGREEFKDRILDKPYFTDYDEAEDSFVLSKMMINFSKYQYDLLYNIYAEGFSVLSSYPKEYFQASGRSSIREKNKLEIKLVTNVNFGSLLKDYLELKTKGSETDLIEKFELEYPIFEQAYNRIGVSGISSLNYSKTKIERFLKIYSSRNIDTYLSSLIGSDENYFISNKDLKQGFIKFLKRPRINTTGIGITSTKIENHAIGYDMKPSQRWINGKSVHGYVIKMSSSYILDLFGYTP